MGLVVATHSGPSDDQLRSGNDRLRAQGGIELAGTPKMGKVS